MHVRSTDGLRGRRPDALDDAPRAARASSAASTTRSLGADAGAALVQFARAENATQLVLGASRQSRWTELVRGSVINHVIRAVGPDRRPRDLDRAGRRRPSTCSRRARAARRRRALAPRRRARRLGRWRVVGAAAAHPRRWRSSATTSTLPSDLLLYLLRRRRGRRPRRVASRRSRRAVAGFLLANWYFTPPFHEFTIAEARTCSRWWSSSSSGSSSACS